MLGEVGHEDTEQDDATDTVSTRQSPLLERIAMDPYMETTSSRYEGALSFAHRSSPGAKISIADIDIVDRQCRDPRYSHEGGWTTKREREEKGSSRFRGSPRIKKEASYKPR